MSNLKLNRRKFLKSASLTAIGAGMASGMALASENLGTGAEPAVIKEYRKFGKTGFQVSDFSSGNPTNEAVLKALLNSGVNLIDTGEVYYNGNSEKKIGNVIKDFDRSKLFINSKLYTETSFPSKEDVIERTNKSLERLGTDYVDCMQIHSAENSAILKDESFHAGMEQLKKEGKVRHIGVSCHGNNWAYNTQENLETILMSAINDGRFDVILLAYNFVNADIAEKILDACEKKNIATIIMKSNPIQIFGMLENRMGKMAEEGTEVDEYTQAFYDKYKVMNEEAQSFFSEYGLSNEKDLNNAASRFVLSNPKAHTTIWDFKNFDDIENILQLSGQKLTQKDNTLLEAYQGSKRSFEINNQKLRITIKPGSYDGLQLKVKRKGQPGINNGPKGDLYIILRVAQDNQFLRQADNLIYEADLDLYTALLGGKIEVPTMTNPVKMTIPEGVELEKTLRLKGKGMPKYGKSGQFGDLLVKLKIKLPKKLTQEDKKHFRELKALREKKTVNI